VTEPNTSDLAVLVKDAVDGAFPSLVIPKHKGFECTVDARMEADLPWAVTVTVRWPESVEMLSRDKLATERRHVLLGLPIPSECCLPLSDEAIDLLWRLQDIATKVCQKYVENHVATCAVEVVLDEKMLKEESKRILYSMKVTKVQTSSLYGEFGKEPYVRKQP